MQDDDEREAKRLKALGMAIVAANNLEWMAEVDRRIEAFIGFIGPIEAIKVQMYKEGLEHPSNESCWGSMTSRLFNDGWLKETGDFVKGKTRSSHNRPGLVVYKVVRPKLCESSDKSHSAGYARTNRTNPKK